MSTGRKPEHIPLSELNISNPLPQVPPHDLLRHSHHHDRPPGVPQDAPHSHQHSGPGHGGIEHYHEHRHAEPAPQGLYERISLEFSHTWPGQCYLRFEGAAGAVTMVQVNAADRAVLRALCREEL